MTESQEHQNSGNYPLPKNSINPDTDLGWIKRLLPVAKSHRRPLIIGVCVGSVALILNVAVPASRNEFNTFIASCSSEMAISLANGSMDSSEFMQEIMNNIKIQ